MGQGDGATNEGVNRDERQHCTVVRETCCIQCSSRTVAWRGACRSIACVAWEGSIRNTPCRTTLNFSRKDRSGNTGVFDPSPSYRPRPPVEIVSPRPNAVVIRAVDGNRSSPRLRGLSGRAMGEGATRSLVPPRRARDNHQRHR